MGERERGKNQLNDFANMKDISCQNVGGKKRKGVYPTYRRSGEATRGFKKRRKLKK